MGAWYPDAARCDMLRRPAISFAIILFASFFLVIPATARRVHSVATQNNASQGRPSMPVSLMAEFKRFTKFSFAARVQDCPSPAGSTLVKKLDDEGTDTQGFVARDDEKKEIIVAFRGTQQALDLLTDADIALVPLNVPGVNETSGVMVHRGFQSAFLSVSQDVLSSISSELSSHPDYTLISTGHSLGGSLASIAGIALAYNFPQSRLKLYTFGQPRTGDAAYADFVEDALGLENMFRAVHTWDGVPTLLPENLGYKHHGTEYWNFQNPSDSVDNVIMCIKREDPSCSDSVVSTGINIPHFEYFGQLAINDLLDPSVVCPGTDGPLEGIDLEGIGLEDLGL